MGSAFLTLIWVHKFEEAIPWAPESQNECLLFFHFLGLVLLISSSPVPCELEESAHNSKSESERMGLLEAQEKESVQWFDCLRF